MPRPKGRANNATIVREFLHKKFADLADSDDMDEVLLSVIEKAKAGNHASQKLLLDNMDKVVQWEQRNDEVEAGLEILINRSGTAVRLGVKGNIDNLGHITQGVLSISPPEVKKAYQDYVGPIPLMERGEQLDQDHRFEPKNLYKWNGEVMGLADICRIEGIPYKKTWDLLSKYTDLSIEQAVEEIKEITDHPDNEKYHQDA